MKKTALFAIAYCLLLPVCVNAQVSRPQPPASKPTTTSADDCGCEDKTLPELLAVVNGIRIMKADLSAPVQQRIKELQAQVTDARRGEVDLQINSQLLEAEARRRGVSTAKLLQDEVVAKVPSPTEVDAQKFYNENKARIGSEFGDAKEAIVDYLLQQRQKEAAKKLADRLRAGATVSVVPGVVTPAATAAARARVLATLNGRNITSGDVEDSLKPLIYSVQESVYTLRKQEIDLKINDALLQAEATKKGVSTKDLLDAEVYLKVPKPTEAEAQKFYDENKERVRGAFPDVKLQVVQFLTEAAEMKATSAFAERLRSAAKMQIFLTPPVQPVYQIAVDDQPTRGNPNASVTLVEFTDFECPTCAVAHPILERLAAEYGARVKFVVRDFPLEQHENAQKAAEAAEAAREQGKYWEYVAVLLQNQKALQVVKLKEYAGRLGLNQVRFNTALDGGKFAGKVQRDRLDGEKIGVSGTPSIYVNGQRVRDLTYEGLKAAIESKLNPR